MMPWLKIVLGVACFAITWPETLFFEGVFFPNKKNMASKMRVFSPEELAVRWQCLGLCDLFLFQMGATWPPMGMQTFVNKSSHACLPTVLLVALCFSELVTNWLGCCASHLGSGARGNRSRFDRRAVWIWEILGAEGLPPKRIGPCGLLGKTCLTEWP